MTVTRLASLPCLGALSAAILFVVQAGVTSTSFASQSLTDAPPATAAESDSLDVELTNDPESATTPSTNADTSSFEELEDSATDSTSARYKYSVRYTEGSRRELETVNAASEPLAYRQVREKHPDADSILLVEVRRDGDRVDRSRPDRKTGRSITGPLARKRRNSTRRYYSQPMVQELPDLPFAKLIDQMHQQNIQNILRGKTFQDVENRMTQARIELARRRAEAARRRSQAGTATGTSSGRASGNSRGNKSGRSSAGNEKPGRRKGSRLGDRVDQRGKKGKGKSGGKKSPGDGTGQSPGAEDQADGNAGIGLGSGIPVNPQF